MLLYGYIAYNWLKGGTSRRMVNHYWSRIAVIPKSLGYRGADPLDLVTPICRKIERMANLKQGAIPYNFSLKSYAQAHQKTFQDNIATADPRALNIGGEPQMGHSTGSSNPKAEIIEKMKSLVYVDLTELEKINLNSGENTPHKIYILAMIAAMIGAGQATFLSISGGAKGSEYYDEVRLYRQFMNKTRMGTLHVKEAKWRGQAISGITYYPPYEHLFDITGTFVDGYKDLTMRYPNLTINDSKDLIASIGNFGKILKMV